MRTEPCEPTPRAESSGGNGVIHMGLLNIIRRMHLRQKLSIREIARLTGVSRNTVPCNQPMLIGHVTDPRPRHQALSHNPGLDLIRPPTPPRRTVQNLDARNFG